MLQHIRDKVRITFGKQIFSQRRVGLVDVRHRFGGDRDRKTPGVDSTCQRRGLHPHLDWGHSVIHRVLVFRRHWWVAQCLERQSSSLLTVFSSNQFPTGWPQIYDESNFQCFLFISVIIVQVLNKFLFSSFNYLTNKYLQLSFLASFTTKEGDFSESEDSTIFRKSWGLGRYSKALNANPIESYLICKVGY